MPPARIIPIALACACAALPAPLLHRALAATAGTLFEAAPLILAASLVPGRWTRRMAGLVGCGCGSRLGPAALSLPAAALCWTLFGPWVALGRFGAGIALAWMGRREHARAEAFDPLADLTAVAIASAALAFALEIGGGLHLQGLPRAVAWPAAAVAGIAIGIVAPCATSAVALAAMLRGTFPVAAGAVLATAGLLPFLVRRTLRRRNCADGAERATRSRERDARPALVLIAVACAALALRGPSGLVHPRLLAPVAFGAGAALVAACRGRAFRTATRGAFAIPAVMLAALVVGSPLPASPSGGAAPDDVYPGETLAFTGMSTDANGDTSIVRYAIACCRADASAIVVATDRRWNAPAGWVTASGTIARTSRGFVLRVKNWRRIAPPADPFVYR